MRMTRQRKLILDVLERLDLPCSAEELLQASLPEDPTLALSTIYRNLERMQDDGQVLKTRFQDGIARFEKAGASHRHYLVCTHCGLRRTIEACPMHALQVDLEGDTGFRITDHQLTLYGLCPACQENKPAQPPV